SHRSGARSTQPGGRQGSREIEKRTEPDRQTRSRGHRLDGDERAEGEWRPVEGRKRHGEVLTGASETRLLDARGAAETERVDAHAGDLTAARARDHLLRRGRD